MSNSGRSVNGQAAVPHFERDPLMELLLHTRLTAVRVIGEKEPMSTFVEACRMVVAEADRRSLNSVEG